MCLELLLLPDEVRGTHLIDPLQQFIRRLWHEVEQAREILLDVLRWEPAHEVEARSCDFTGVRHGSLRCDELRRRAIASCKRVFLSSAIGYRYWASGIGRGSVGFHNILEALRLCSKGGRHDERAIDLTPSFHTPFAELVVGDPATVQGTDGETLCWCAVLELRGVDMLEEMSVFRFDRCVFYRTNPLLYYSCSHNSSPHPYS